MINNIILHIINGNYDEVEKYIKNGGDVNDTDEKEMSLIYYAVEYKKNDIVKLLLKAGACQYKKALNGFNAMLIAECFNYTDLVKLMKGDPYDA